MAINDISSIFSRNTAAAKRSQRKSKPIDRYHTRVIGVAQSTT
ncbi:MAG: hypothetical protein ACLUPF_04630 [Dorea sp.]